MTVSVTAARLLAEAFRRGDFTGWPDFVRMDDGQYMSQLMLSVSKRKIIYSVIARTQDPKSHIYMFVLCVDQAAKGMEAYHNKVGIMNAVLSTKNEDEPKLVIGLDYGEYLVLDAVEQPAVRSMEEAKMSFQATTGNSVPGHRRMDLMEENGCEDEDDSYDDLEYEDDGSEEEDDEDSGPGLFESLKERASRKSVRKSMVRRAKENMPPRDRMGINRSR